MAKTGWRDSGGGSWAYAVNDETLAVIDPQDSKGRREAFIWDSGHGIARRVVRFDRGWTMDEIKLCVWHAAERK